MDYIQEELVKSVKKIDECGCKSKKTSMGSVLSAILKHNDENEKILKSVNIENQKINDNKTFKSLREDISDMYDSLQLI